MTSDERSKFHDMLLHRGRQAVEDYYARHTNSMKFFGVDIIDLTPLELQLACYIVADNYDLLKRELDALRLEFNQYKEIFP